MKKLELMIDVIPGINDAEIDEISRKVALAAPHTRWIQIDFADKTLVPTQTYIDIGAFSRITESHPAVSFEAHLMVANPEKYIGPLAKAGFKRIIAHIESDDPRRFLEEAQYESVEVGLAIDGPTEFEQIEPYLDQIDVVLVMTIESGPSGQPFLPETVEKIKLIHESLPDMTIEVDGGMNPQTAKFVKEAGATRIVSTTFLFTHPQGVAAAMSELIDA
jgi:ribulose-phosphate 3-epimerase